MLLFLKQTCENYRACMFRAFFYRKMSVKIHINLAGTGLELLEVMAKERERKPICNIIF